MSRRLVEEWLPIAALGEESLRERRSMTSLPPTYYLHVWWARRPLVASRAAIMASLLPADADRQRFMHVLGIHGDPADAKKKMENARRKGIRIKNPYAYDRAFKYSPDQTDQAWFAWEIQRAGISGTAACLDPTAGGGSIPFEALRLGINAFANDINPVAALIEKLTTQAPLELHTEVYDQYMALAQKWRARMEAALADLFPQNGAPDVIDTTYLFARTIRCPHCGGLIPLSPNWRLAPDGTGVRLVPHAAATEAERLCSFEIVRNASEQSEGTVKGGRAACPYPDCERIIEGDAVKAIAQAGGMGEQLYAIVYKKRAPTTTKSGKPGRDKWVRGYRAPTARDDVFEQIRERLAEKVPIWEAMDIVPDEEIPEGLKTNEPRRYGMRYWADLFSPRQLYCHATSVETFRELLAEAEKQPGFGEAQKAAFAYLAIALDKLRDYDSRMTRWHTGREVMVNTFDRHDFAMKWSYAEMAPLITGLGYDWAIKSVDESLTDLIKLLHPEIGNIRSRNTGPDQTSLLTPPASQGQPQITLSCKSAESLDHIADHSIDAIVMDPPYYNNVMYAELSDFFYVWLKRTAGYVYPQLFKMPLTDKENEAVANPALFRDSKKPQNMADDHYRQAMAAIFRECRAKLKPDGILLLMFTHKATGAWDALAKGLIEAGFVISASWPVNTEAEGSLHIRDKAAANSTIFLVCRPRQAQNAETVFWEELEPQVRQQVLQRVSQFQQAGIGGIDLYLASFGPGLELFSRYWPVRRGSPAPRQKTNADAMADPYEVTPEDVLQTARAAVKDWSLGQILRVSRKPDLDPLLEWFVLAWHIFRSPQFPYDEALNLARVAGLDMERDIIGAIAEKKASDVVIWDSETRAAKAALGPAAGSRSMLDALHQAARLCRQRNLDAAAEHIRQHGLDKNLRFQDALAAALEVLPPSARFTGQDSAGPSHASADDFEALENLRRLLFAEKIARPRQLGLWDAS